MKKNYFKILDLPQRLLLDQAELKKNYFNHVKDYSTDPILDRGSARKKSDHKLKLVEEAYHVLKDRILRIEHLLDLEGPEDSDHQRIPRRYQELARQVSAFVSQTPKDGNYARELKQLHAKILSDFSSVSIELTRLERAWDDKNGLPPDLLRKLKKKSTLFHYVRSLEHNIQSALNACQDRDDATQQVSAHSVGHK